MTNPYTARTKAALIDRIAAEQAAPNTDRQARKRDRRGLQGREATPITK